MSTLRCPTNFKLKVKRGRVMSPRTLFPGIDQLPRAKQHHLYQLNICDLVASTPHPPSSASSLAWNKSPNQSLRSALNGMEPKSAGTESEKYQRRQETATASDASGESSQNEETGSCCLSGNGNEDPQTGSKMYIEPLLSHANCFGQQSGLLLLDSFPQPRTHYGLYPNIHARRDSIHLTSPNRP